jgi:threonine aldolase
MGGTLHPIEDMQELHAFCEAEGIPLHLDGARIWNAHVATRTPMHVFGDAVDSISICFSKGLGAPVGSMLLGTRNLLTRAHKYRKIFGGGMRQSGMLAAAARYAVEHHLQLLSEDHRRAREFADALDSLTTFHIRRDKVQTNMVLLDFSSSPMRAAEARTLLREAGIEIGMGMGDMLRAVFHMNLDDVAIHRATSIFTTIFT